MLIAEKTTHLIPEQAKHPQMAKQKKISQKKQNIPLLALCLIVCLGIGSLGGIATASSVNTWYQTLNKPFFNPPNWLFAPVWTVLYLTIGFSLYLALESKAEKKALIYFSIQLALNFLWSILFFGLKSPSLALAGILALWLFIFLTIKEFSKKSKLAGKILIPYLLWVSFAALLNLSIVLLN